LHEKLGIERFDVFGRYVGGNDFQEFFLEGAGFCREFFQGFGNDVRHGVLFDFDIRLCSAVKTFTV